MRRTPQPTPLARNWVKALLVIGCLLLLSPALFIVIYLLRVSYINSIEKDAILLCRLLETPVHQFEVCDQPQEATHYSLNEMLQARFSVGQSAYQEVAAALSELRARPAPPWGNNDESCPLPGQQAGESGFSCWYGLPDSNLWIASEFDDKGTLAVIELEWVDPL